MNERCLNLSHSESCRCGAGWVRCAFCFKSGHVKDDCPEVGIIRVRTEEATASPVEVNEALAERMMLYRAAKNALIGYAQAQGFAFPASILAVDPDYTP